MQANRSDCYQMGDVLLPGFKFGGAEGTAVVVEGSEIFQVDLEQIA